MVVVVVVVGEHLAMPQNTAQQVRGLLDQVIVGVIAGEGVLVIAPVAVIVLTQAVAPAFIVRES